MDDDTSVEVDCYKTVHIILVMQNMDEIETQTTSILEKRFIGVFLLNFYQLQS